MAKMKYVVMSHFDSFYSNSRNARKHLLNAGEDTDYIVVYTNTNEPELVCMAKREVAGLIVVGSRK